MTDHPRNEQVLPVFVAYLDLLCNTDVFCRRAASGTPSAGWCGRTGGGEGGWLCGWVDGLRVLWTVHERDTIYEHAEPLGEGCV